jgi:hypothetical protein
VKTCNFTLIPEHVISHALYPKDCLLEAIKQFEPFCVVTTVSSSETESVIYISSKATTAMKTEVLTGEFLNYVLNLSCRSVLGMPLFKSMRQ